MTRPLDRVNFRSRLNNCAFILFYKEIGFKNGEGNRVRFWKDAWCSNLPLMLEFPDLYNIALNKEAWVRDNMERNNDTIAWNIFFF